ncbi:uncharacterized protein [Nicotiana tomentosiformis]|uniref:uncharacterized protein n=1 Tax=Nicotiana tomentosiformis TaxID=4098 RepID=UPI00388CE7D9
MRDERVNRILVDGGSSMNILPIRTVKELSIPMNELSESHVIIQGFNKGGQRAIGAIRLGITIEDMQSSAWLYVIDAKTSYNVFLGRPWIHENKVVPSTYHQCLEYYEGEVEKNIVADDEPFTDTESQFADAKFYLKNRIVKELKADDVMKRKNDEPMTKIAEVTAGKDKAVTEEGLTVPIKQIEAVKLSSMPLAGFVELPTKRIDESFNPNAYRLFAKAGYNPNELSKLGKLPSECSTRKPREGLQPSPVQISIRRVSNSYITVEDESVTSSRPSVFDRLGKSIEFRDVFAWSYKELPGLDPKVVVHHLAVKNGARLVKQAQMCFRLDLVPLIEIEINKLIEAGFIREVKYPTWVSSIVAVRKKNGQIRVCVDFRDLNNACPRDEFPHPTLELMIDATNGYEEMSFMDGSSGYNHICIVPKDEELTAFRTPKGIYCYR